jgi:hypothetical protein
LVAYLESWSLGVDFFSTARMMVSKPPEGGVALAEPDGLEGVLHL